MNDIRKLRDKLGLNQQQMAEWLGTSRSLVALFENDRRNLPTSALLKLAKLETILTKMEPGKGKGAGRKPHPDTQARHTKAKKQHDLHAKSYAFKAVKMRRKLKEMQAQHDKAILLMDLLDNLKPEMTGKNDKKNLAWLQLQYTEVLKKLRSCDEAALQDLNAKIREMKMLEEFHAKLSEEDL